MAVKDITGFTGIERTHVLRIGRPTVGIGTRALIVVVEKAREARMAADLNMVMECDCGCLFGWGFGREDGWKWRVSIGVGDDYFSRCSGSQGKKNPPPRPVFFPSFSLPFLLKFLAAEANFGHEKKTDIHVLQTYKYAFTR